MNTVDNKKKLTNEEKAVLIAEAMAAARGKDIFPQATAEARKFCEALKTATFAPGVSLK